MELSTLRPAPVWRHFSNLCRIPRASGQEKAVRDALAAWARGRGLGAKIDAAGNLVLDKPARRGYENRPGVVLQGHLDMVCQKNSGSAHDFAHDPIRPVLRDGWVMADETTLGADNGIGVALALAALEDEALPHPALEVLLTVDEESGMHGALGLEADALRGRLLLNLDTEEWGELYIGCAGSVDVVATAALPVESPPDDARALAVRLSGLAGGHSGIDIHRGRGNAIVSMARLLDGLAAAGIDARLAAFAGGTAHNALPREATATLLLAAPSAPARLRAFADEFVTGLRGELPDEDGQVRIDIAPAPPAAPLRADAARAVLSLLRGLPCGVRAMSERMPGVVETSNNIGELRLDGGRLYINAMVRSLRAAGLRALSEEIAARLSGAGLDVRMRGDGPEWTPAPDSRLLALARDVYRETFGGEAHVQVIHAGLECGVFSALWPDMEMISFGPTIHGAHAPGERVEAASVERAWNLLAGILAAIPIPAAG
ncbi:MAG: aminoacyl-histidine dipeptidase [Azoarcus sp.]|jgi:dipeptidase D|nr:aminoacyl-histidine dipeptidase [Azoarcus sp.]